MEKVDFYILCEQVLLEEAYVGVLRGISREAMELFKRYRAAVGGAAKEPIRAQLHDKREALSRETEITDSKKLDKFILDGYSTLPQDIVQGLMVLRTDIIGEERPVLPEPAQTPVP